MEFIVVSKLALSFHGNAEGYQPARTEYYCAQPHIKNSQLELIAQGVNIAQGGKFISNILFPIYAVRGAERTNYKIIDGNGIIYKR